MQSLINVLSQAKCEVKEKIEKFEATIALERFRAKTEAHCRFHSTMLFSVD
jgi:hypothetical protein